MSGFERSAPIPGSQGPRRSQMVRFNNAPPPLTPWRAEVLEAQKQLEALEGKAKKPGSASRSRSRGRRAARERDRDRDRDKMPAPPVKTKGPVVPAPSATSTSGRRPDASAVAPETGVVLRQARERGEGWYAAVARAAESWDTVQTGKKPPKQPGKDPQKPPGKVDEAKKGGKEDPRSKKAKDKDDKGDAGKPRRKEDETEAERERREEREARARAEEEKNEQERQRLEFEAKAEERRLKADEERRKAEEERRKSQELKKQRQERLKGAFAVGGDDSDKEEDREAKLVRKVAEKKRTPLEAPLGAAASASPPMAVAVGVVPPPLAVPAPSAAVQLAAVAGNLALLPKSLVGTKGPVDPELSEKLRFEKGLNPAEAFMRLQERKRKGRRAEFGGPPRGCSPWRDGKRGISFEDGKEG